MIKNILVFFFLCFLTIAAQTINEVRGVKLTNVDSNVLFSDKNITEAMDYLASIGINSVYCVVWNGGYTFYPSKIMNDLFAKSIFPGFQGRNPFQKVVIEAHRNGIEVFPWFEYGFASHYSGGSTHILTKFPSWGLKDTSGNLCVKNGFYWMSAVNPDAQNFMTSIIIETIDNEDVDGILVSDRIPAMPVEGGYDSVTVSIYKNEHNGNSPTKYYKDEYWKRWRANKLNDWLKRLQDSVKSKSSNLIFATSPSVYPWGYDEYLQDSKTWVDSNLCELFIPQLYRYNISDYIYELDRALSYVPLSKRNIFSSGILIKSGSYVISPSFLFNSLQANRQRNTNGEVFFFYEGLRADQNKLGDTLKATYYNSQASLTYRNGNVWRPKGLVLNEDDPDVTTQGKWSKLGMPGFKPNVLIANDSIYSSITYNFDIPYEAWYSLYIYNVTNSVNTTQAPYTVYSQQDSIEIKVDQKNSANNGWYKLCDIYLTTGRKKILKLDNTNIGAGKYVIADASMLLLNRKLSPTVVITGIEKDTYDSNLPTKFKLLQNYPNPFNSETTIEFHLPKEGRINLKLYDILGREIESLLNEVKSAGRHLYKLSTQKFNLTSGIYFYQLRFNGTSLTKKFILLK